MWQAVEFDAAAKQRIAKAAEAELRLRLEGMLFVVTEVGPFKLLPLTLRDIAEMQFAGNALVTGGDFDVTDVLQLIWATTPNKNRINAKRYLRRCGKHLRDDKVVNEVYEYFLKQLNDIPSRGKRAAKDYMSRSFLVTVIDAMAESYGWTKDEILNLSVSFAFQLFQQIEYRLSKGKFAPISPMTSKAQAEEFKKLRLKAIEDEERQALASKKEETDNG